MPAYQRLGAVAAGHAEQVGAAGHGLVEKPADVDGPGSFQQDDLGPGGLGLSLSPNSTIFLPPERGFMIKGLGRGAAGRRTRAPPPGPA